MRLVAALACLLLTNQVGFSYQSGLALLEPPDGKVYHGTGTAFSTHVGYLAALADSTIYPKVRSIFLSVPGTRPPAMVFRGLREFFASADTHGFIPEVGLFLVTSQASDTGATDSIIAVSTVYDSFLDSIIAISQNYGKAMFVRIGPEFNGWWNGGGYHPYYYVLAFRKIVNMYAARGFRDSIATVWCYEPDGPNDFDSVGVQGPLWYPGDTFVDWFGLDVFDADHFDQALPDTIRGQITRKGKSERFLAMARARSKPVYLNETSAKGVNITADSLDSWNDWNAWFVKFWQLLDHHIEIKGFNYLNQDWEHTGYPGWGDARIQNSPYITTWYRGEMRRPRYIHLHSSVTSVHAHPASPEQFVLEQNYPNPFNPTTTIKFSVGSASGRTGEPARVTLKVYDLLGREVVTLVDERKQPGVYTVTWDAGKVPSGAYFYRLTAGGYTQTKAMVVMK
jgi:hypothetical protein